jgi:hypothetical protein
MSGIVLAAGHQYLLPNGSVGAPALAMTGATNTGWFFSNGMAYTHGGVLHSFYPGGGVACRIGVNVGSLGGNDGLVDFNLSSVRWTSIWSVNGTVQTSCSEFKNDIQPLSADLSLPPGVYYRWKPNEGTKDDHRYVGFIADDLPADAFEKLPDGTTNTRDVRVSAVVGILCSKVRSMREKVALLEARITAEKLRRQSNGA